MRVKKVLKSVLGLGHAVVLGAWGLHDDGEGARPRLVVKVRTKLGRPGRCGGVGWCRRGTTVVMV